MSSQPMAIRVVLVDDHEDIRDATRPGLAVVRKYANTEAVIRDPPPDYDVVVLDLQLDGPGAPLPDGRRPAIGTHAIRNLLDAGHTPIVLYTGIWADGVIAGCLAAGAQGAVSKNSARAELARVVRDVALGQDVVVDTHMASALLRLDTVQHAGGLSAQQYNVLRLCARGLSQDQIAQEIGVASRKVVENYLREAIHKLSEFKILSADSSGITAAREAAAALGFDTGLVDWADIEHARRLAKRADQAKAPRRSRLKQSG